MDQILGSILYEFPGLGQSSDGKKDESFVLESPKNSLATIVLKRENNVGLIDVFPSINHFSIVKNGQLSPYWVQ